MYPESFPVANAINLFGIIRNGQLVERKAEAGWDEYQIQGYGHRVLLGVPAGQSALAVSTLSVDDQCHVKNLIQAIEDEKRKVECQQRREHRKHLPIQAIEDEKRKVEAADATATRDRPFLRQLFEQLLPILLRLLVPA